MHNHKFIAIGAGERPMGLGDPPKMMGDLAHQIVAALGSEDVGELEQSLDAQIAHHQPLPSRTRQFDFLIQNIPQGRAVGQAREGVMGGQVLKFFKQGLGVRCFFIHALLQLLLEAAAHLVERRRNQGIKPQREQQMQSRNRRIGIGKGKPGPNDPQE